jgi:tripartite-type tricarboxylate transporter receptor subunit TctC
MSIISRSGTRVLVLALLAGAFLAIAHGKVAQAQSAWPAKPVRVIIPFPPGAGAENAARLVSNHWSKVFGQGFVIDARPGGNTMIGAEAAAKSAPDGYTLFLCAASTMVVTPALLGPKAPINAHRDFVPVGLVSRLPFFLVVPATVPVNSVAELIALARSRPGAVTYASNGNGTAGHLGFEVLKRQLGVDITHIPYKGYAQALPDLLGGRVTTMMADLVVVGPTIKEGRLRALAATSLERSKFLPGLPTMAELGFPGYEVTVWFGVFAPAGTPADIVNRLNAEMRKYLVTQEAREGYEKLGHEAAPSSPEELRAQVASDADKYGKIVRDANIKLE